MLFLEIYIHTISYQKKQQQQQKEQYCSVISTNSSDSMAHHYMYSWVKMICEANPANNRVSYHTTSQNLTKTWNIDKWRENAPGHPSAFINFCSPVTPCGLLNNCWGNGALRDGTKPLPESMLTNHQRGLVTFPWGQFHRQCSSLKIAFTRLQPRILGPNELTLGHQDKHNCFWYKPLEMNFLEWNNLYS